MEKRRIAFLRRKFLADLTEAPKTFLCSDRFTICLEEATALFLALRRRTAAWMLWVQVAPNSDSAGAVEQLAPGFLRGYVDRLAPQDDGTDISLRGWLTMLGNARLLQQGRPHHEPAQE